MNKLRMRFYKIERAIYISHLDLMRTMQRAFLRANLPLCYSEGFNPHAVISVLLPLSVGMSSVCELMDFRLNGDFELSLLPERLNRVMPEGIVVHEIYPAERKVRELKWLRVGGVFEYDEKTPDISALDGFFAQSEIIIEKRTKKGPAQSDIKPGLREIAFAPHENGLTLTAIVSAQEPTLNPEQLVSALRRLAPELCPDFAKFRRLEVYDADMRVFR